MFPSLHLVPARTLRLNRSDDLETPCMAVLRSRRDARWLQASGHQVHPSPHRPCIVVSAGAQAVQVAVTRVETSTEEAVVTYRVVPLIYPNADPLRKNRRVHAVAVFAPLPARVRFVREQIRAFRGRVRLLHREVAFEQIEWVYREGGDLEVDARPFAGLVAGAGSVGETPSVPLQLRLPDQEGSLERRRVSSTQRDLRVSLSRRKIRGQVRGELAYGADSSTVRILRLADESGLVYQGPCDQWAPLKGPNEAAQRVVA